MLRFNTTVQTADTTPSAPIQGAELKHEIHAEQIRLLQIQVPGAAVGSIVGATILTIFLWDAVPRENSILWGSLVLLTTAIMIVQCVYYRRAPKPIADVSTWGVILVAVSLVVTSAVWGSAGYLLFPSGNVEQQLLLAMMLFAGIAAASIGATSYWPAFLAISIPWLPTFTVRLLMEGSGFHLALAATAVIYGFVVAVFSLNIHRTMLESMNLRFEKTNLINELTNRSEEAERANLAKSRFLAAASHDLRQPLHALGILVGSLDEQVTDPDTREIVGSIESSVFALDELFNALLEISNLDAGALSPKIQNFPIKQLLERMAIDYRPRALEKNLNYEISPCDAIACSDPMLVDRILRNLIANAVNYTESGRVHIGCQKLEKTLRIEVSDTGVGISPDRLPEIFQEFYQIGNPERDRKKGLGLGLAIVQRVSQLLKIPLEVTSEPGRGSTFTIELPLGSSDFENSQEDNSAVEFPADLSNRFVLILEDDVSVRTAMQGLLRGWNCEVLAVESAEEALDSLGRQVNTPDIIIADFRLRQDKTGVQAINRINSELNTDIPAIIVTGDTAPERIREAKASGYQLLHKPLRPAKLRALLSYTINNG